jgi:hypothetical protein
MPYNKSSQAFDDIKEAFERALAAPKGIRIPCLDRAAAIQHRARFNYFRKMNREDSKKIYDRDHPMWGCSVYDKLIVRLPSRGTPEENVLYIIPHSIDDFNIEEIQ